MDNRKTIIVSVIVATLFIIAIGAISYAFYTANVLDSGTNNKVSSSTARLGAKFEDGAIINIENMIPGDNFSKSFSLENMENNISYKIVVDELVNEFESYEDITYVLKEDDRVIKEGTFPNKLENNELSDIRTINKGERKNYTITITYQNTEEDQTQDMGKIISGKLFIKEV